MSDKTFSWVVIGCLLTVISSQVYFTLGNRTVGRVNQAYGRATNCFAATSPPNRTPQYVKACYDKAEAATGTKIERFGDAL